MKKTSSSATARGATLERTDVSERIDKVPPRMKLWLSALRVKHWIKNFFVFALW
jgi:hypothetical protein